MSTSISVGVVDPSCFPTYLIKLRTGEPVHTVSKERMVPESMILSERKSQLSITDLKCEVVITLSFQLCSACYIVKNSRKSASAINPVTTKIDNSCTPTTVKLHLVPIRSPHYSGQVQQVKVYFPLYYIYLTFVNRVTSLLRPVATTTGPN